MVKNRLSTPHMPEGFLNKSREIYRHGVIIEIYHTNKNDFPSTQCIHKSL